MSVPRLQAWVHTRQAAGTADAPFLRVDPSDNVLVGLKMILAYLGIKSPVTLYQWVELYGFPAIKRPDGMWMTTMTSIDQWIFMACELDNANRPHSRGSNVRYALAKQRLEARIDEDNLRKARGDAVTSGPRASWDKGDSIIHPEVAPKGDE